MLMILTSAIVITMAPLLRAIMKVGFRILVRVLEDIAEMVSDQVLTLVE